MPVKLSLRELRGLGIVAVGGQIQRASDTTYIVKSQGGDSSYKVEWIGDKWTCNCQDYLKRGKPCKHIYAVNFLLDLPRIVLLNSEAFARTCPHCGSADVRTKGFRYNKSRPVRMFRCRSCGKRFRDNAAPEHGGARVALAVMAADLYYKGLSLRDIANHPWQVYGIEVSPSTVHRWVTKMTEALKMAFEEARLVVGDNWLADETVVKVDGEPMYLWNIMDRESRVYIASLLTSGREAEDAANAMAEAIKMPAKSRKRW